MENGGEISHLGLSRVPLYEALIKKFVVHIQKFSRNVFETVPSDAVGRLASLWSVWGVIYSFGVLSRSKEIDVFSFVDFILVVISKTRVACASRWELTIHRQGR